MHSVVSTFLDRLAERFTAILAGVVSSRVESLRAEAQAEQISYRCQARWRSRPARQCVVWLATEVASHAFGGTARGELRHPTQATHDLGVAAVWL